MSPSGNVQQGGGPGRAEELPNPLWLLENGGGRETERMIPGRHLPFLDLVF